MATPVTKASPNLTVRRALPEESQLLTQIAHDAKRHWGYPENWIKHWTEDLTISPEFVAANQVFVAEDNHQVTGFYALVIRQDKAELDHLWVSPAHIGSGVGKELFIHAMNTASGGGLKEVGISSDPNAEGFYRKMGAHHTGDTVSEIDGQSRTLPRLKIDPKTAPPKFS